MKDKIVKAVFAEICLLTVGSVIAGVIDRSTQRRADKQAKTEEREIHKPYGIYEKYIKRSLDFGLSALMLITLSPVMVAVGILVRINLGSPVLFVQERPGRGERVFKIFKFRTMTGERGRDGKLLSDEDRLTGFGKLLRATSLDELPELWNIVKGDMSVVGPRPLLIEYLPRYNKQQRHRHDVRPGLTGLAQISGRNSISWEEKFKDDCRYVEKITFKSDLKIICRTIGAVLKRTGISSDTSVTMEKFNGSD